MTNVQPIKHGAHRAQEFCVSLLIYLLLAHFKKSERETELPCIRSLVTTTQPVWCHSNRSNPEVSTEASKLCLE